jgi:predicted nucleic acid-binding protein
VVKIVVDAYAWIEVFIGSREGEKVKQTIEQADEVFTPDTVMAEVARKYHREGAEEQTIRSRLGIMSAASSIVPIDDEMALEAARCYVKLLQEAKRTKLSTPSLFDAITLAMARLLKAKVITGDKHFKNLPETIWVQ